MLETLQVLEQYGYWAVFGVVLLDFLGAPITAIPLLLVAGVAANAGKISFGSVVFLGAVAAFLADTLWYGIGRLKGQAVLSGMCRLSRNRPRCVSRSTALATDYGAVSLLLAKFVPGVASVAAPAAGAASMSFARFLVLDAVGSVLWASIFTGAGYLLRNQSRYLLDHAQRAGAGGIILFFVLFALIVAMRIRRKKKGSDSSGDFKASSGSKAGGAPLPAEGYRLL